MINIIKIWGILYQLFLTHKSNDVGSIGNEEENHMSTWCKSALKEM